MLILTESDPEFEFHKQYFKQAADVADHSTCHRSKCGCVIVNDVVIGKGYNGMPRDCGKSECIKDSLPAGFKSDKSCCVHAEQRAIIEALQNYPGLLAGSSLYFARLDYHHGFKFSGAPYCTICSKMALDSGISNFILWHQKGITIYNTLEYNDISFQYPNFSI